MERYNDYIYRQVVALHNGNLDLLFSVVHIERPHELKSLDYNWTNI